MILTTTPTVDGKTIVQYKQLVFGEVITGANFLKDIAAQMRDFVGGRSKTYEEELIRAREDAINEMVQRAESLGANAIVGIDVDYEILGPANGMMMISASGTAVVVE